MTILSGNADDENTFDKPDRISPVATGFTATRKFNYSAPSMTQTVIRIKKRNK